MVNAIVGGLSVVSKHGMCALGVQSDIVARNMKTRRHSNSNDCMAVSLFGMLIDRATAGIRRGFVNVAARLLLLPSSHRRIGIK